MKTNRYQAKSGTMDEIEETTEAEKICAREILNNSSSLLETLDVPYEEVKAKEEEHYQKKLTRMSEIMREDFNED